MTFKLVDKSIMHLKGILEDVLVKVEKFLILIDFIALDIPKDRDIAIILGHPFLATRRVVIDVQKGEMLMWIQGQEDIFKVCKDVEYGDCCSMQVFLEKDDIINELLDELEDSLAILVKQPLDEEVEGFVVDEFFNLLKYPHPIPSHPFSIHILCLNP